MRDIRNDLQERADIVQDQIKAAAGHFERMVAQLRNEHDARVADLKVSLAMIAKLMEFEERHVANTSPDFDFVAVFPAFESHAKTSTGNIGSIFPRPKGKPLRFGRSTKPPLSDRGIQPGNTKPHCDQRNGNFKGEFFAKASYSIAPPAKINATASAQASGSLTIPITQGRRGKGAPTEADAMNDPIVLAAVVSDPSQRFPSCSLII